MGPVEPAPAPAGRVSCPWCGSDDVSEVAPYSSLLMTSQWFCDDCGSPFERVRHRGDDGPDAGGASGPSTSADGSR